MIPSEEKERLWFTSGIGTALLIAILAVTNVLAHFVHFRLDLSKGSIYSIGAGSRRIVRALPDPILITVYYSKELPPQIASTKNYIVDLLKEYAYGSRGKLRLRSMEVGDDPSSKEDAISKGITPVTFDIVSNDKFEQRQGFLGVTMQFEDKKDLIAYVQGTSGLEYELTSKIKAISSASKPVLGLVVNDGALTLDRLDNGLVEKIKDRYEVRMVNLGPSSNGTSVPANIKTLFFMGPKSKATDEEVSDLEKYVKSGGSLCLAVDAKEVDTRAYLATDLDTGLGGFLKSIGLELQSTIVMDEQSMPIQVTQQQGPIVITNVIRYPPIIMAKDLNDSSLITQRLDALAFPFASPIKILDPASAAITVLVRSSKYSWAQPPGKSHYINLTPFQMPPMSAEDLKGPFNLVVALQKPSRIVVLGTSKVVGAAEFKPIQSNESFFLNTADWLSQDVDLIAIRSKSVDFHPLQEVPARTKQLLRYLILFLPSCAAVLAGLGRLYAKQRRRLLLQQRYGPPETAAGEA